MMTAQIYKKVCIINKILEKMYHYHQFQKYYHGFRNLSHCHTGLPFSGVVQQEALECGKAVCHFHNMHLAAHESGQLGW